MSKTMVVDDQLQVLSGIVEQVDGRLDIHQAQSVLIQATERLGIIGEQTVVALAGATGSGKSSLFNAVTGTSWARSSVFRPTTVAPMGIIFRSENTAIFDWLGVTDYKVMSDGDSRFTNLVLLDLPDHDSTQQEHCQEVERLVRLVDEIFWVVDPQKYADMALHHRFLRPLVSHAKVIKVILNQIDTLTLNELHSCLSDLRQILDEEGLTEVPIVGTSAITGIGIPELQRNLADLVNQKDTARKRIRSDVSVVAKKLASELDHVETEPTIWFNPDQLAETLSRAAGEDHLVTRSIEVLRQQHGRMTGWSQLNWFRKVKKDSTLQVIPKVIDHTNSQPTYPVLSTTIMVNQTDVFNVLHHLGQDIAAAFPMSWRPVIRRAVNLNQHRLVEQLQVAFETVSHQKVQIPSWWKIIRILQWVCFGVSAVSAGWMTINLIINYVLMPLGWRAVSSPLPLIIPTLLFGSGLVANWLMSLLIQISQRHNIDVTAAQIRHSLRTEIKELAVGEVLAPIDMEYGRYHRAKQLLAKLEEA